jgi:hypothetical protein
MNQGFLKVVILFLMIGTTFMCFSQKKDIKMEVFEKVEEVLPFTAVDKNGRAVTDLEKREIVLLVNNLWCQVNYFPFCGRNIRLSTTRTSRNQKGLHSPQSTRSTQRGFLFFNINLFYSATSELSAVKKYFAGKWQNFTTR